MDRLDLNKPEEIALAIPSAADETDTKGFLGRCGMDTRSSRESGGSADELTTVHGGHSVEREEITDRVILSLVIRELKNCYWFSFRERDTISISRV
jgi:hypothetical protein